MSCQENHPDFCGEVTWELLWWDIFALPAIVQLVLILLLRPCHRFWIAYHHTGILSTIQDWVGDGDDASSNGNKRFIVACSVLEILCSFWFAGSWAYRTYAHTVSFESATADFALSILLIGTYLVNLAQHHFSWTFALKPESLITVLTIVPTLTRPTNVTSLWFSFGYLRCLNALQGLEKLDQVGFFRNMHDRDVLYMRSALSVFTMVTSLVGTVFNLEIIGDPEVIEDRFIQTSMGDLSVVQMTYWIFTTISTVGYGDFSPTTVLCRLFIIFAIVVGVVFFSNLATELSEAAKLEHSGKGEYRTSSRGAQHIVLLGGGVRNPSAVTQSFIQALFKNDSEDLPDLVMISGADMPDSLKEIISQLPKFARHRCKYFVADPTNPDDLERVKMAKAASVVIIPSLLASDMGTEDSGNMLRGLAIRNMYPNVSFLLMLLRSTNKKIAVLQGFLASRTFSVNEQKSGLFAQSCLSRGYSTLITLCLIEPDSKDDCEYEDAWREDYELGRRFRLHAIKLGKDYAGLHFRGFATQCSRKGVLPLAVQVNGKIKLNPDRHLEHHDLIFCLARSVAGLWEFHDPADDGQWRQSFLSKQQTARLTVKASVINAESSKGSNWYEQDAHEPEEPKRIISSMVDWDDKARAIAKAGGHFILVLLPGAPWRQVQVFLRTLRADHLPVFIPVLVLLGHPAPAKEAMSEIFLKYPETAFVNDRSHGEPSVDDLVSSCGLEKARSVALIPGIDVKGDKRMMDGPGLTLLACIENYCANKKLRNIPVTLEMHQEESVRYMQKFSPRDKKYDLSSGTTDPKEGYVSHPRVASGSVFTGSCLGAALARSWSLPGTVELIEALILGSNNQLSHPWQIRIPKEFVDKSYGDFARSFIDVHGALTLGLFRLCFRSPEGVTDRTRFVIANPLQSTIIQEDDWAMMLGDASFGQYCFSAGLLANTEGLSSPETSINAEKKEASINVAKQPAINDAKPFEEPLDADVATTSVSAGVRMKAQKLRSLASQLTELADALEANESDFVDTSSTCIDKAFDLAIPTARMTSEEVRASQVKGVRLEALLNRVSKV